MTVRPSLGSVAEELYARLEPFHRRSDPNGSGEITDEILGWPLLIFFGLLGKHWQEVDDLIRDTDDGPGWSAILDPDRIAAKGMAYLAQYVGVDVPKQLVGETVEQAAARIRDAIDARLGNNRGTPQAMRDISSRRLTGLKRVIFNERQGGSIWHTGVVTYVTETPDPAGTFRDLLSQKPHGIILTHTVVDAWGYDVLKIAFDDYGEVKVHFAGTGYTGLKTNNPPAT